MAEITIPYNYKPRTYQVPAYNCLPSGKKRAFLVWHRRAGKDKTFINILARETMKRVGIYFYILPYFKQARRIIWEGLDSDGFGFIDHFPKEIITRKENQQMVLEFMNGSKFYLLGSDNIDSIVGTNPVGVIFSEFSLHKPQAWNYLRPILLENKGWAMFNCTPRGRNHAHKLWVQALKNPHWFTQLLTVNDTVDEHGQRFITNEMIQQERDEGMPEELVQQEYFCDWDSGLAGSYYGAWMKRAYEDGRITKVSWNPALPVYTGWDLGWDDTNTLWFAQLVGKEIHIIRCYSNRNQDLGHYINKCNEYGYNIARHYFPHDIEVHELTTGRTRKQFLIDQGVRNVETLPRLSNREGVSNVRSILPRCWFDENNCFEGIEGLKSFRREFDEKNDTFRDNPVKDWAGHFAKGFQSLADGLPKSDYVNSALIPVAQGHSANPIDPDTQAHIAHMERFTNPDNYDPYGRNNW